VIAETLKVCVRRDYLSRLHNAIEIGSLNPEGSRIDSEAARPKRRPFVSVAQVVGLHHRYDRRVA